MVTETSSRDVAGIILAAIFILIGVVLWWDTTTMTDPDSYVFPRSIIVALVAFCLLLIVINLVRPQSGAGKNVSRGSTPRRMALIAVMLAGAAAMPVFGFILSGLVVFLLLIVIAMYEPWTPLRSIVYPLAGIALVAGFYLLFAELLLVPLPVGSMFE